MAEEANGPRLRLLGILVVILMGLLAGRTIATCSWRLPIRAAAAREVGPPPFRSTPMAAPRPGTDHTALAVEKVPGDDPPEPYRGSLGDRKDPLAIALLAVQTSAGRAGVLEADRLVRLARGCDAVAPSVLLALAWTESGLRPDAIRATPGRPRMEGIFQLNERYVPAGADPFDLDDAFRLVCSKLKRWRDHHRDHCGADHLPLAHHFSGNVPSKRASVAASKVLERARLLEFIVDGESAPVIQ